LHDDRHHLAGFFADVADAQVARSGLEQRGLPSAQLQIFGAESAAPVSLPTADHSAVLLGLALNGAVGSALGTGVGVLAELGLVPSNASPFVAGPPVTPLAMLGWGAGGGTMAEPVTQALKPDDWFFDILRDAVASGQFVLLAEARSAQEMAIAAEVLEASVGDYQEIGDE
jgi:hypothetical protein